MALVRWLHIRPTIIGRHSASRASCLVSAVRSRNEAKADRMADAVEQHFNKARYQCCQSETYGLQHRKNLRRTFAKQYCLLSRWQSR